MSKKVKKMLFIELGILFLVLIVYISIKTGVINAMPECLINKHFHILCPSCGGTRCIINFLVGNFDASFKYHPIFFIMMIYFIMFNIVFIINAFRKKDVLKFLYPTTKFWIGFIIIIIIFTIFRNVLHMFF